MCDFLYLSETLTINVVHVMLLPLQQQQLHINKYIKVVAVLTANKHACMHTREFCNEKDNTVNGLKVAHTTTTTNDCCRVVSCIWCQMHSEWMLPSTRVLYKDVCNFSLFLFFSLCLVYACMHTCMHYTLWWKSTRCCCDIEYFV